MLPRPQRLVAAADHRSVARRGRRGRRGSLVVKWLPGLEVVSGTARVGVVVPKALGSAPVRNRLRRRLQHLAAGRIAELRPGSLVVLRAEPGAELLAYQELARCLDAALDAAAVTSVTAPNR